ncbi:hypothetical protein CU669_08995 [Paramagnetospirillum kuznetsovii]|uniref:Uncharacterized protein n=1 Tax=Paramagnetospirillum kuznetsovii TaxID=2053833 RepID=A0A364NYY2_9PROT|nr:hypothetical protein CU669_08995 [Paramagnetospirillum kuznetsovii]
MIEQNHGKKLFRKLLRGCATIYSEHRYCGQLLPQHPDSDYGSTGVHSMLSVPNGSLREPRIMRCLSGNEFL